MRTAIALAVVSFASAAHAGYIAPSTQFLVDQFTKPLLIPANEHAVVSLRINDVTWNVGTFTRADAKFPRTLSFSATKETATFDWDRMSSYFVAGPVDIHYRIDAGSLVAVDTLRYPLPQWWWFPDRERLVELQFRPEAFNTDATGGYIAGYFVMTLELVPEPSTLALVICGVGLAVMPRRKNLVAQNRPCCVPTGRVDG